VERYLYSITLDYVTYPSGATATIDDYLLTVLLGALEPGEYVIITVSATIREDLERGAQLFINTAILCQNPTFTEIARSQARGRLGGGTPPPPPPPPPPPHTPQPPTQWPPSITVTQPTPHTPLPLVPRQAITRAPITDPHDPDLPGVEGDDLPPLGTEQHAPLADQPPPYPGHLAQGDADGDGARRINPQTGDIFTATGLATSVIAFAISAFTLFAVWRKKKKEEGMN